MILKTMDGAQALVRCLESEGVEYIFGLSGGAAIPIFDALITTKTRCASSLSTTFLFVMSRALPTWEMVTPEPPESLEWFW